MPKQKYFDRVLIFIYLYQHAKNEAASSICFSRNSWFKNHAICLADSIWPSYQKQGFSKYRIFAETQQIIYTFTIEQILWILMTNFKKKIKKTYSWSIFLPISQNFGAKKVFLKNPTLSHNFIRVSSTMSKFREI